MMWRKRTIFGHFQPFAVAKLCFLWCIWNKALSLGDADDLSDSNLDSTLVGSNFEPGEETIAQLKSWEKKESATNVTS